MGVNPASWPARFHEPGVAGAPVAPRDGRRMYYISFDIERHDCIRSAGARRKNVRSNMQINSQQRQDRTTAKGSRPYEGFSRLCSFCTCVERNSADQDIRVLVRRSNGWL